MNKNRRVYPTELWDNIKWSNINLIGVPEGEERERTGQKNIWWYNGWEFSEINDIQPKNPRGSENPKQNKYKEKHTKTHRSKTVENWKLRGNLEGSQKIKMLHKEEQT